MTWDIYTLICTPGKENIQVVLTLQLKEAAAFLRQNTNFLYANRFCHPWSKHSFVFPNIIECSAFIVWQLILIWNSDFFNWKVLPEYINKNVLLCWNFIKTRERWTYNSPWLSLNIPLMKLFFFSIWSIMLGLLNVQLIGIILQYSLFNLEHVGWWFMIIM